MAAKKKAPVKKKEVEGLPRAEAEQAAAAFMAKQRLKRPQYRWIAKPERDGWQSSGIVMEGPLYFVYKDDLVRRRNG